jgi:sulfate transport system permease protein
VAVRRPGRARRFPAAPVVGGSVTAVYLGFILLLPLAALVVAATGGEFVERVTSPQARAALVFTVVVSIVVAVIDAVTGLLVAWVLVRDDFPGKNVINAMIDLPFALPTIVAGLTLLALYGPTSPVGIDLAFTRAAVLLALLFVTLPFVVRAVQPVLESLDTEMEEAAASLGARPRTIFLRIVLPTVWPALLAGAGLAFGRAIGEFGSVVLISGNLPFNTEVASVHIAGLIENGDPDGAAAVSLVLLIVSFVLVLALHLIASRGLTRERTP